MSTGRGESAPPWRSPAPHSGLTGRASLPPWRADPPPAPYRTRAWKLAAAAGLSLAALAAVVWVGLWMRPPEPAHLIILQAGYDNNLVVPPNPYGKAGARQLAGLNRSGGFFRNQPGFNGAAEPTEFRRGPLLPELEGVREKCVVVVLAAHGGRDRDGAFLFANDTTASPTDRIRIKTVIERLGQLPAKKQKLLILDATEQPAFPELGLIHNDFASALADLEPDIAAVPNLVVFASSGPDQRSWASPEWGTTAFFHYLVDGLKGGADTRKDKRVSAWDVIEYVRPRVRDWVRDHRAALQTPTVLPAGAEGESRARAMHLALVASSTPSTNADLTPFEPPPELEQAWQEHRDLARGTPPPEAYTPHTWREYEAWLLRFESALVAGDEDGARTARAKAADARQRIEAARQLDVSPQTLALPEGLGGARHYVTVPPEFKAGIARVADPALPQAQRAQEWAAVRGTVAKYDPAAVPALWGYALIDWVAADPSARLPVVRQVYPLLAGMYSIRPAELNFLLMLADHAPPPGKAAQVVTLLHQVLNLRVRAEQANVCIQRSRWPYTEYARPKVASDIDAGDTLRRQAEDLVFGTATANWDQSARLALLADGHYAGALAAGYQISNQVADWHSAAARLPWQIEWQARAAVEGGGNTSARETAFLAQAGVWEELHRRGQDVAAGRFTIVRHPLIEGLPLPPPWAGTDASLAAATPSLLQAIPEFEGKITQRAESVHWLHDAAAVLTAPPVGGTTPADRARLVREYRRVSRQLLVTGQTRPERLDKVTQELTHDRAFDLARRRAWLILARVGRQNIAKFTGLANEDQAFEFRLIEVLLRVDGRQALADSGARLGEFLNSLAVAADKPGPDRDADRALRLVTPHAAANIVNNPALAIRKAAACEVLLAQARRTDQDHWYSEGNSPYYLPAIARLQDDARRVLPATAETFRPLRDPKEEPFPVRPLYPDRVAVTDEPLPEFTLAFTRSPDPRSGRPGFPVFWADTPFPVTDGKSDGRNAPGTPERTAYGTETDSPTAVFVRSLRRPPGPVSAGPAPHPETVRVTGFYRGRILAKPVPIEYYAVAERTAVTVPTPKAATLAVVADPALAAKYGYGSGAVSIVLDCSGSMRPPKSSGQADGTPAVNVPEGRYAMGVQALTDLLTQLPPGTRVSILTFGRRTEGAKTPEDTIRPLLPPEQIGTDRAAFIEKVLAQARSVTVGELWERSPIVRAVVEAKDALRDVPGPFKAVVLISDASDNRYDEDPMFQKPKRSIKECLEAEFKQSGVSLSVVALPAFPDEAASQAEFRIVEKIDPPGRFVTPPQAGELARWLRAGLNPRIRYSVTPADPASKIRPFDLSAGLGISDGWYSGRVLPGPYRLKLTGDLDLTRYMQLGPGDRLLLSLTEEGGKLSLKRFWFAERWPGIPGAARAGNDQWKLAVLRNAAEANKLRMLVGIGPAPEATGSIAQPVIGDVWFDLLPDSPKPPAVAARWRAEPGYPGPCWAVEVGGWPGVPGGKNVPAATIDARWISNIRFQPGQTWIAPADGVAGIRNQPLIADGSVVLDSAEFEEHEVEVSAGVKEKRMCLVARLTYPAGKPAWVRPLPDEFEPAGSEIRFYLGANEVTCLFWWNDPKLDPTAVNAAVRQLQVIHRQAAFAEADKAGRHLKLDGIPTPSATTADPGPPAGTP